MSDPSDRLDDMKKISDDDVKTAAKKLHDAAVKKAKHERDLQISSQSQSPQPGTGTSAPQPRGTKPLTDAEIEHRLKVIPEWFDRFLTPKPDDIQKLAHRVLRHRLILGFEAARLNVTPENIIDAVLQSVRVP